MIYTMWLDDIEHEFDANLEEDIRKIDEYLEGWQWNKSDLLLKVQCPPPLHPPFLL